MNNKKEDTKVNLWEKMATSMFEATLVRIAEKTWEDRFGKLEAAVFGHKFDQYGTKIGQYGQLSREELQKWFQEMLKDIIQNDENMKARIRQSLVDTLEECLVKK